MIGDFVANTKIKSAVMNTKLNGLADGSLDDDANKLQLTRQYTLNDFVVSGLTIGTSANLTTTIMAGVAIIKGNYVAMSAAVKTFTASKDTWVSLSSAGAYTYQEVANNAAAPTLPANSIWIARVVTNASLVSLAIQYGFDSGYSFNATLNAGGNAVYPTAPLANNSNAWTRPTFNGAWVDFATNYSYVAYIKDAMGFIHLRGLCKHATTTTTGIIFNLPFGFRPNADEIFAVHAGGGQARVDITTNGNVSVSGYYTAGSAAFVSLAGITFRGN